MKLKNFIEQFSNGNVVYVENKDNLRMSFFFNDNDKVENDMLMDWYLKYTDLSDIDIICIKQVFDDDGRMHAFTFKVDSDATAIRCIPSLVDNAPLWFKERVEAKQWNIVRGC